MNQHKDLLYRQKYATYQLNNRTFSTQNTKISARSLAISYICFQVRIVRKKRKKTYYQLLRKIWWLPHPRQGLYTRNCNGRNYSVSITPDDHLEGPYLLKTRELPGAPPPGPPAGALRRTPGPHPYEARTDAARCATRTDFSAHPFFLQILGPPLYTSPFARPSRLPPEASILGGGGGGSHPPPPQSKIFPGGGKHIVFPRPPPPQ